MLKSVPIIILAIALGIVAWLLPMRGEQATAQPGTPHILVVEFDIVPAEIDKFMTEIKELAVWAVKELGCRQFSIAISQKDPNHVLLFEVWDSAAASMRSSPPIALKNTRRQQQIWSPSATYGLSPRSR